MATPEISSSTVAENLAPEFYLLRIPFPLLTFPEHLLEQSCHWHRQLGVLGFMQCTTIAIINREIVAEYLLL
jgi:hypothetical protein